MTMPIPVPAFSAVTLFHRTGRCRGALIASRSRRKTQRRNGDARQSERFQSRSRDASSHRRTQDRPRRAADASGQLGSLFSSIWFSHDRSRRLCAAGGGWLMGGPFLSGKSVPLWLDRTALANHPPPGENATATESLPVTADHIFRARL